MSEMKTILHRIDATDGFLAQAGASTDMQTINLHDGALRIRTPHGAIDISIDHERQPVAEGVEIGPCTVLQIRSAYPLTVASYQSIRSLFLHFVGDAAEPDPVAVTQLHAPATRVDYTLTSARDALFAIREHSTDPDAVKRLAESALADIDGDQAGEAPV